MALSQKVLLFKELEKLFYSFTVFGVVRETKLLGKQSLMILTAED